MKAIPVEYFVFAWLPCWAIFIAEAKGPLPLGFSVYHRGASCRGCSPTSSGIQFQPDQRTRRCSNPTTEQISKLHLYRLTSKKEDVDGLVDDYDGDNVNGDQDPKKSRVARVKKLAKNLLVKPLQVVPMPQAIAAVLREATFAAVEEVEDLLITRNADGDKELEFEKEMVSSLVEDAFKPLEVTLEELEETLKKTRAAIEDAKAQSIDAIEAIQLAAIAQAEGAATAVAQAEKVAELQVMKDIYSNAVSDVDVSSLTFEDVDYDSSEMAPPFLDEDSCLVPGEPVVRVEKAPENSRRIFAGIDILASVDDVWNVLTQYHKLQEVVPNLVVNDVLELYDGKDPGSATYDTNAPAEVQCKQVADQMKGSLLKQVGGAKVAGINFSARTTLEVREWPQGMPDFANFQDAMWMGKSRDDRAFDDQKVKLKRYRFPRPFALSSLPTRDISMQSVANDDGEFRMYQGVWRMQPLPGCAAPGQNAMRLTYAVEVSPRAYLPVALVERRIVKDLCTNLEAIRNFVTIDNSSV